jgi:alpha-D-ribose 1-methylphosphonate 5-triphosphate synthase subunit PhnG
VIAQAEHGKVFFVRLHYKPTEKELRDLLSLYPFVIEDKIKLYCAPPENPVSCYLSTGVENIVCDTVTATRVSCYSSTTGHVYSTGTSRRIMESLKIAYTLCVGRLRKTLDQLGVSTVPAQNKPEGEPKDKFDALLQRIKQMTGIPIDQAIPSIPKTHVELKEDMPELAPCYEVAKIANVPEFTEALNQHDFVKARRFIIDVTSALADKNVLDREMSTVRECGKVLSEKK